MDCGEAKKVALQLIEFIERHETVLATVTLDAKRLKEVLEGLLSCDDSCESSEVLEEVVQ